MSFKPPKIDPKKSYVMKTKGRAEFVSQLTPMINSPEFGNAHRFDGKWLIETCWRWWTFHEPVEVDEAFKLYHKPLLEKRGAKVTTKIVRKLQEKSELEDGPRSWSEICRRRPRKKKEVKSKLKPHESKRRAASKKNKRNR